MRNRKTHDRVRDLYYRAGYIAGRRDGARPDWRDALTAVRDALDIPYPRTAGDEEIYKEILDRRLMQALVTLRSILDRDDADVAWHVEYLRAKLVEMPAESYQRWADE
ncbi:hypothetical protein NE236_36815 [Actinoallomurus purpureus]|uniref:hypothetical protein n=1 Tax=Actinoallomurus purpureus TaxID=478114 RepID=UPI002093E052|nr:hypothetical protein [Actinoallomurus purpureus]MCO6010535.1 hypothetical protein [Actinoallomurus purpureus]